MFNLAGGAVSWGSFKQSVVATSTTQAEYIGQDAAARELLFLLQFLKELDVPGLEVSHPTNITGPNLMGDNQGALALAKNPVHHKLSKHFDIKLHFVRDLLKKKLFVLRYVPTKDNTADIMTKPLDKQPFEKHRSGMGMIELA